MMNEAETRAEHIDPVLEFRNARLATVEAKAWDKALTEGVAQTKHYAGKLAIRFAYASNGQGIYGIDMDTGVEGEVATYPTPLDLWKLTFALPNAWRDRFASIPFEDRGGFFPGRYYQDIAVERVLAAIADGRNRLLLTLATGTGKTFIALQIAWKLFNTRWNLSDWKKEGEPTRRPRILFLADRNILADQAYNAFSAFPEDALVRIAPEDIRKKGRVPTNGNLFFTIFQSFMSGPIKDGQPSPYFGDYPRDFFDFIVIDECHRGGASDESTWRGILDYFAPAMRLGLTATPRRQDNVDTYAYFGEPVFTYSLKEGINDGFLTPFRVRQISTTIDEYVYTPDDTLLAGEIEVGKRYQEGDFNKVIEIREREKKRVEIFLSSIDPREKTIIFCATQAREPSAADDPPPRSQRIRVTLADGKARSIQHMTMTSFWHRDGTPMSAQQFMAALFGRLPEFFSDEDELRTLWSAPDTRRKLLEGLAEKGFGNEHPTEMQKIIAAEKSDLFDVLAYVAYALAPLTREERAAKAMALVSTHFNSKQQVFLDFVLSHYVSIGVEELDPAKLTPLLRLKYHDSMADAVADLGRPDEIGRVFNGFQKYLYQQPNSALT